MEVKMMSNESHALFLGAPREVTDFIITFSEPP